MTTWKKGPTVWAKSVEAASRGEFTKRKPKAKASPAVVITAVDHDSKTITIGAPRKKK